MPILRRQKELNILEYQGQEEDHYTHVLMCILDYKNQLILPQFIKGLIPQEATKFQYSNLSIHTRTKYCPQPPKKYGYVIGIAPYRSGLTHSELEDNSGSIPDAWICGENFNLLFEFKIRGALDEGQISAHKRLLKEDVITSEEAAPFFYEYYMSVPKRREIDFSDNETRKLWDAPLERTAQLIARMPMTHLAKSAKKLVRYTEEGFSIRFQIRESDNPTLYGWTREICEYRLLEFLRGKHKSFFISGPFSPR